MLSILIPVYNYDCRELVFSLHRQCAELNIPYEIRVYDDCSVNVDVKKINSEIKISNNIIYKELQQNLGFCKIRNLLAKEAKFENLLFLDSDVQVTNALIKNYLNSFNNAQILCGGLKYNENKPRELNLYLKWLHGKKREELSVKERDKNPYRTITAANLWVIKEVYLAAQMDENSSGYGYNDTMLGYKFMLNKSIIKHIENTVLHEGLMDNEKFINRSMEAIKNLLFFEKQSYIKKDFYTFIKILSAYKKIKYLGLINWFLNYYNENKMEWILNLKSEKPNLKNLDKLKLGQLIALKQTNDDKNQ